MSEPTKKYDYGSTQVNLAEPDAKRIQAWATKFISASDLAADGFETDTHITVKYGLTDDDPSDDLKAAFAKHDAIKATLKTVERFDSNPDFDVLYVAVDSADLHDANKAVKDATPTVDTHPTYTPHVTLAYVNKGACKELIGSEPFSGEVFTFDTLHLSAKDGEMHGIPIGKTSMSETEFSAMLATFAGARHNEEDRARMKQMHDALVEMHPDCCPAKSEGTQFSNDETSFANDIVTRNADLFAAGHYPSKNLTVSEADIARLAQAQTPIPIYFHHVRGKGKIKLGVADSLSADGKWLKGKIHLRNSANEFLNDIGVHTMSVTVTRALNAIPEISVTDDPAVDGARMFAHSANDPAAETICFALGSTPEQEKPMPENEPVTVEQFQSVQAELEKQKKLNAEMLGTMAANQTNVKALEFSLRKERAETHVKAVSESGKLPIAAIPFAVGLLLAEGTVSFANGETVEDKPVAELAKSLLDNLPVYFGKGVQGKPLGGKKTDEEEVASFMKMGMSKDGAEEAVRLMKENEDK